MYDGIIGSLINDVIGFIVRDFDLIGVGYSLDIGILKSFLDDFNV